MKRLLLQPLLLALAIALAVFLALTAARRMQWLQRWELAVYDAILRLRAPATARDPKITIVAIEEADVRKFDYPLRDRQLARLLKQILAAEPRAIGLDLYRDLPEPRDGSELPELAAVLKEEESVITIFLPELPQGGGGVPAPLVLQTLGPDEWLERICVNDFPSDGAMVRRAWLYMGSARNYSSLAFRLAMIQLPYEAEARGVPIPEPVFGESFVRLGKTEFRRFREHDGGYYLDREKQEAGGFQILIDFQTPASAVPRYSISAVLDGKAPADAFRDRVVLIGGVAESVKDKFPTPLDPFCPGVLLHAQVLDQIVRAALEGGAHLGTLPGWLQTGGVLLAALLGAGGALALRRWPLLAPLGLLAGIVIFAALVFFVFRRGVWLPPVEPGLAYLGAAVATLAFSFTRERRERNELMHLFSRHVSDQVAQDIWEHRELFLEGGRPRSQELTATVMFSDFVGFTTVAERLPPARLMEWLNEGLGRLARRVESHGGIVNKYMGDAIMAVFGVPVARTTEAGIAEDAANAVRCALEMSTELDWLNAIWRSQGRPQIWMRIGIHTGKLVAGSLGTEHRIEFTVIGDTVNTASRLESSRKAEIPAPRARSCRILIGEATYRLVSEQFEVEPVGEITLKGKSESVNAYSVLGEKGVEARIPDPIRDTR